LEKSTTQAVSDAETQESTEESTPCSNEEVHSNSEEDEVNMRDIDFEFEELLNKFSFRM